MRHFCINNIANAVGRASQGTPFSLSLCLSLSLSLYPSLLSLSPTYPFISLFIHPGLYVHVERSSIECSTYNSMHPTFLPPHRSRPPFQPLLPPSPHSQQFLSEMNFLSLQSQQQLCMKNEQFSILQYSYYSILQCSTYNTLQASVYMYYSILNTAVIMIRN